MSPYLLSMPDRVPFVDYVFTRQRWIMHALFWAGILIIYALFFGRRNSNYIQTFFFVGLLMPVTMGTTYFLNYYLLPRYLMRGRYAFFLLYFIYTLTAAIFLEMMISVITFIVIAEVNIRDMSPESVDIVFLLISLLVVVFSGVAIKLLLHWQRSREDHQKLMSEKIEAELKFLKGQLNPHFLFNTLNNLYYLTTEKSDSAPQAVLQLSEMLDYVMHSGKEIFVPLESELKQVDNYIALEKLRYEDRVRIDNSVDGDVSGHTIGPMMIVTLVENAFKHGVMNTAKASWMKIIVTCTDTQLTVCVENSVGNTASGQGIGLENLKSQLSYLYPDKHHLEVSVMKAESFQVQLTLTK